MFAAYLQRQVVQSANGHGALLHVQRVVPVSAPPALMALAHRAFTASRPGCRRAPQQHLHVAPRVRAVAAAAGRLPEALLFDCDGVLVDTGSCCHDCWGNVADELAPSPLNGALMRSAVCRA